MNRIKSIDAIRGLVMIIMALDHVRDIMHTTSLTNSPTDLQTTSVILFFTRWITYLCAPVFVFLSGTSAYLAYQRKKDRIEQQKFLLTRGLWLIILEFTVVNFGLWFNIHFNEFIFSVIATIGFGFIILSLLLKMSFKTIGFIGLLIVCFHNLVPSILFNESSILKRVLMPLFIPGAFPFAGTKLFIMGYPPIPWLGVLLLGYGFGPVFLKSDRKKHFLKVGLASLVIFFILRTLNIYGDSVKWAFQKNSLFTILSYINLTKYPPSLLFDMLFLGIMMILFYIVEESDNLFTKLAGIYGKVPLFYFLLHWYIIHLILFVILECKGYAISDMNFGTSFGRPKDGAGIELWAVYIIWILVVLIMYPLCKIYSNYKHLHPESKWLKYL